MEAPDKIFVKWIGYPNAVATSRRTNDDEVEYINKEKLLKWLFWYKNLIIEHRDILESFAKDNDLCDWQDEHNRGIIKGLDAVIKRISKE